MGYYRVGLDRGWCDCGKFQAFCMPCSHVITVCSKAWQDPSNLLSIIYKAISICNVYNNSFLLVAKEDYWHAYQGEVVWNNQNMRRKKKGCPNSTRIQTEMDTANKIVRLYNSCCQPGQNSTNCPNFGASSLTHINNALLILHFICISIYVTISFDLKNNVHIINITTFGYNNLNNN